MPEQPCKTYLKKRLFPLLSSVPFAIAAACVFFRPQAAASGVARGLSLCTETIIPTMFPFLVLSQLILSGPLAQWAGFGLRPVTRMLGIPGKKASAALLCGWLGGFAAGARAVGQLYRQGDLSARQAGGLLICAACSGSSFVVGCVGTALLGSTQAGWILFLCQLAASVLCGVLLRPLWKNCPLPPHAPGNSLATRKTFVDAVSDGVQSTALLCGYVVLFSFLASIASPPRASSTLRYIILLPLEVTGACAAACEGNLPNRLFLCAAAISLMGASVFVQVRAFAGADIPLRALTISRLLHLPIMVWLVWLALHLFPQALVVSVPSGGWTPAVRMPADVLCVIFVLCSLIFSSNGLHLEKNRV